MLTFSIVETKWKLSSTHNITAKYPLVPANKIFPSGCLLNEFIQLNLPNLEKLINSAFSSKVRAARKASPELKLRLSAPPMKKASPSIDDSKQSQALTEN